MAAADEAGSKLAQQILRVLRSESPDVASVARLVDDQLLSGTAVQRENVASMLSQDEPLCAALAWKMYSGCGRAHAEPTAPGGAEDHVCRWLFSWYQSEGEQQRAFVLRVIPALAWAWMYCSAAYDASPPGIEAVLLCIYNAAAKSRAGRPLEITLPSLTPTSPAVPLTAAALGQHDSGGPRRVAIAPPLELLNYVCESARYVVLRVVLSACCDVLPAFSPTAKALYCRVVAKMATLAQPFEAVPQERFPGVPADMQSMLHVPDATLPLVRRISMPTAVLCEALRGIGFCVYTKDTRATAEEAARAIERHAVYYGAHIAIAAARAVLSLSAKFTADPTMQPNPQQAMPQAHPPKPLVYTVLERSASANTPSPRGSLPAAGAAAQQAADLSTASSEEEAETDYGSSDDETSGSDNE